MPQPAPPAATRAGPAGSVSSLLLLELDASRLAGALQRFDAAGLPAPGIWHSRARASAGLMTWQGGYAGSLLLPLLLAVGLALAACWLLQPAALAMLGSLALDRNPAERPAPFVLQDWLRQAAPGSCLLLLRGPPEQLAQAWRLATAQGCRRLPVG